MDELFYFSLKSTYKRQGKKIVKNIWPCFRTFFVKGLVANLIPRINLEPVVVVQVHFEADLNLTNIWQTA